MNLKRPPLADKHVEERLKLLASGCQNMALALLGAVYLAPAVNKALVPSLGLQMVSGLLIGLLLFAAMKLLAYIPVAKEPTP